MYALLYGVDIVPVFDARIILLVTVAQKVLERSVTSVNFLQN